MRAGNNFESRRNREMNNGSKNGSQFVSSIFIQCRCCRQVLVFHQSQANHGTVFQASVVTPGRKKKRAEEQRNEGGKSWGCGGENDKEGKNETGEIKGAETDGQRDRRFLSERAARRKRKEERDTDVMANHFSLEQSQELFVNAAAPRQRLVWGWHAAVAGYVGVTSAPGPGGLKTQGCLSGEEGQIQARTHCGNRAALAIWGPSDGEAYLEMLPKSPLWARWKGRRNHPPPPPPPPTHPQHSLTPFLFFLFHPTLALFALSSLPFLCT